MKHVTQCQTCTKAGLFNDGESVRLPLNNDGYYTFTCPRGHDQHIVIQQLRFEVLADTAVQAIADGYYRDAVSSFAASLERFYEYYVRVVAADDDVPQADFDEMWRQVAAQSERQLGVFLATYLRENNKAPPDLGLSKKRNDVIHRGYVPTEAEAITFGEAVIGFIQPILDDLHAHCAKGAGIVWQQHIKAATDIARKHGEVTSYDFAEPVFNMGPPKFARPSLREQVAFIKSEVRSGEGFWIVPKT